MTKIARYHRCHRHRSFLLPHRHLPHEVRALPKAQELPAHDVLLKHRHETEKRAREVFPDSFYTTFPDTNSSNSKQCWYH